jgi:hypothetical protein
MTDDSNHCPGCGSRQVASRRQLFHLIVEGITLEGVFNWYDKRVRHAYPPKSLFVILGLLVLGLSVPAMGFWFLGHFPALQLLVGIASVLIACLLIDFLLTYKRYRNWVEEWLCGECQNVFVPAAN